MTADPTPTPTNGDARPVAIEELAAALSRGASVIAQHKYSHYEAHPLEIGGWVCILGGSDFGDPQGGDFDYVAFRSDQLAQAVKLLADWNPAMDYVVTENATPRDDRPDASDYYTD